MKPKIEYRAKLTRQGFNASRARADVLRECLATWPEDTDLRVTIQQWAEDKTNPQLAYAHAAISPAVWLILQESGYRCTEEQAWEYYQQDIATTNKEIFQGPFGRKTIRIRLSKMDKERMSEFIDEAIQFCAENGQVVEPPEKHQ